MNSNEQPYSHNGVLLLNPKIYVEDKIALLYRGLLVESGADRIYAYVGYGEEWTEEFIEMEHIQNEFKTNIDAKAPGILNICFKDSADNWDNNSGLNYTFNVMQKKRSRRLKENKAEIKVQV